MTLQGFDRNYYLKVKLEALRTMDNSWINRDIVYLENILQNTYGLSAEDHYRLSGYREGLAPNPYFNADEYILAKATQLSNAGLSGSIEEALTAFNTSWTGNPYDHYLKYGGAEGINPSNAFDDSSYLTAKLDALQASQPDIYNVWSVNDVRAAFTSAGLTVLGHYLAFGASEGLTATEVPASERVTPGNDGFLTLGEALATQTLPTIYKINDAISNLLSTSPGVVDILSGASVVNVKGNATIEEINSLIEDRGYTTVDTYNLFDTAAHFLSAATNDIVAKAATIALSQGILVSEYSGTKALFTNMGQTFVYTLNDSLANLFSAASAITDSASSYSLTNNAGTSLGILSKNQLEFVQDAANYERGKWDFDTTTYLVGEEHDTAPYSSIVYITAKFSNGTTYSGSGVVVGKNDILTASHLVYSEEDGGLATRVTVYPGRDGATSPFGSYIANKINYFDYDSNNDGLLTKDESEYDLAVLGFNKAFGNITGWFGLDPHQTSNYYNLSGYPGIYSDSSGPHMTNDYGYATEDDYAAVFNYATLATNPGNSGGPLWYEDGTNAMPYVAGIVSTGSWATDVYAQYTTILNWINGNDYLLPTGSANSLGTSMPLQTAMDTSTEAVELTGVHGSTPDIV